MSILEDLEDIARRMADMPRPPYGFVVHPSKLREVRDIVQTSTYDGGPVVEWHRDQPAGEIAVCQTREDMIEHLRTLNGLPKIEWGAPWEELSPEACDFFERIYLDTISYGIVADGEDLYNTVERALRLARGPLLDEKE